jgi:hypothetical protein
MSAVELVFAPQFGQKAGRFKSNPHSGQKRAPSGMEVSQFGQGTAFCSLIFSFALKAGEILVLFLTSCFFASW